MLYTTDFISDMATAYSAADLVISRAGAGSISEFCLLQKPVILVPSPNVAEDHQTKNALALVNKEAALYVKDAEAENELLDLAIKTVQQPEVLKKLRALEAEMEEAENQSEYWMEEEHLDMEKSDNYEAEADRLYQEVYKMHNQVADFIVNLTSGQIDKVTAMLMMRQRRSDVERILGAA